ncbi:hypothetical protein MXB_3012, partial [Myxobolus squamalis]
MKIKVFKGESENIESLVHFGSLLGTIVSQKISFENKCYQIKISNFNDTKSNKKEMWLKFSLYDPFIKCLTA